MKGCIPNFDETSEGSIKNAEQDIKSFCCLFLALYILHERNFNNLVSTMMNESDICTQCA